MLGKASKSTIKLQCTEQAFSEFPNLLFGTQIEHGISYFDATLYLQKHDLQKSIEDFFIQYRTPIMALCDAYDISPDEVSKTNEEGHQLIDGNLVYLFISFVEPDFTAYMCDRIHDIMTNGVAVSDTYLLQSVKSRLNKEVINQVFEDETTSRQ